MSGGRRSLKPVDAAVITGVFTLGGVVAGGLASGTVNFGLARREERRSARAAARLVLEEATQIRYALAAILEHGQWRPIEFVATSQWDGFRETLAHHLRSDDWSCVVSAYEDLQRLLGWVRANDVAGDLDDADRGSVTTVYTEMDHAVMVHLIPLAVHGPQQRRLAKRYHHLRHRREERGQQSARPHGDDSQEPESVDIDHAPLVPEKHPPREDQRE
jgi:hypothetical protein